MSLTLDGPTVPVGNLPRDLAAASEGRLLVSNGNGQIVGVRDTVEVDLDGDAGNGVTRLTFSGVSDIQGIAVTNANAKELLLAVTPGTGELITYDLTNHMECDRFRGRGRRPGRLRRGCQRRREQGLIRPQALPAQRHARLREPARARPVQRHRRRDAGLPRAPRRRLRPGPMALSPTARGSPWAVASSTCLDQIKTAGGTNVDTQVGCDRVYVLDVATNTWLTFGNQLSMPTRPGRYPYAVAWFEDSIRMAFASFQGIDNFGSGDSGWPASFQAVLRIPVGGTLRLADTSNPSWPGRRRRERPPQLDLQHASPERRDRRDRRRRRRRLLRVRAGVRGHLDRPSLRRSCGASRSRAGPGCGRPARPIPRRPSHLSTNGAWYGGCRHTCQLVGGYCPDVCGAGTIPAGFGSIELGSSVRVLKSF
ncbi:MAG: hypothetical protein R3B70_37180 [Polyangiaceae bacterium]